MTGLNSNIQNIYRTPNSSMGTFGGIQQGTFPKNTPAAGSLSGQNASATRTASHDIKKALRDIGKEQKGVSSFSASSSILDSSKKTIENLQAQRTKTRDTSLSMKKLKYQFKDVSSKILRSKTSTAARQAVSAARREIQRLKRQKNDSDVDQEELEAAISHAKAMERVAKKKVKHLEQEEMARATSDRTLSPDSDNDIRNDSIDTDDEYTEDYPNENSEESTEADYDDVSYEQTLSETAAFEPAEELFDELSEGMEEMLEEMGLDEINDALMAAGGNMSPEDIDQMIIRHRNKEMKDIVEADADYLKAVFDHLQKMKGGGGIPGMPTGGFNPVPVSTASPAPRVDVTINIQPHLEAAAMSTIDIAL